MARPPQDYVRATPVMQLQVVSDERQRTVLSLPIIVPVTVATEEGDFPFPDLDEPYGQAEGSLDGALPMIEEVSPLIFSHSLGEGADDFVVQIKQIKVLLKLG